VIRNRDIKPLILKNGYFLLRKNEKDNAQKRFIEFYKQNGYVKIQETVDKHSGWMGYIKHMCDRGRNANSQPL